MIVPSVTALTRMGVPLALGCFILGTLLAERVQSQPVSYRVESAEEALERDQNSHPVRLLRGIDFEGNRRIPTADLEALVEPYLERQISEELIEEIRRAATAYYVDRGYLNSGAVVRKQSVLDGIITLSIVEGELSEVRVFGLDRLRPQFIKGRLAKQISAPLNLADVKDSVELLKSNPLIQSVSARLEPKRDEAGRVVMGQAVLDTIVEEADPIRVDLIASNNRPPSIGGENLAVAAEHRNLLGYGDRLSGQLGLLRRNDSGLESSELDNIGVRYDLPVSPSGTVVWAGYDNNDYFVFEEPFTNLDIGGSLRDYSLGLRQPLSQNARQRFDVGLDGQVRRSETTLFGEPFTLSPGAVNGEERLSVLRLRFEWSRRNERSIWASRVSVNWGLDAFDATVGQGDRDGEFTSFQWQLQHLRLVQWIPNTDSQLILRVGGQWSEDPLLSVERYKLGGVNSIRGYRENALVRDRAIAAGIEMRTPLPWMNRADQPWVTLAPFAEIGAGTNADNVLADPESISSVGIGVILKVNRRVEGRIDWGYALDEIPGNPNQDLQDHGFHFRLVANLF